MGSSPSNSRRGSKQSLHAPSHSHRRSHSATPSYHYEPDLYGLPPSYDASVSQQSSKRSSYIDEKSLKLAIPPSMSRSGSKSSNNSPTSSVRSRSRTRHPGGTEYLRQPMRRQTFEDALETLRKYDTIIIVDDSGSMSDFGKWAEASEALGQLADKAGEYDADGIDIHFLNSSVVGEGLKNREAVQQLFSQVTPRSTTPLGDKLDRLLRKYLIELDEAKQTYGSHWDTKIKPRNYIIITDGCPSDDPADTIVAIARQLDQGRYPLAQVGLQFLQIGNSSRAARYLRALDDELVKHHIRDMVDTTPYIGTLTSDMIIKILLGGINRRHDKMPN